MKDELMLRPYTQGQTQPASISNSVREDEYEDQDESQIKIGTGTSKINQGGI